MSLNENFRHGGKLYLIRCYECDPVRGRENYLPMVASGQCAWCGWKEGGDHRPSLPPEKE